MRNALSEAHAARGSDALGMITQIFDKTRQGNTVTLFPNDYEAIQAWTSVAQTHFMAAEYYAKD